MTTASRSDHDARYQRLFSHPGVVAQLLRSFVDGPWLTGLDLEAMERLNGAPFWRIARLGRGTGVGSR
jgi:hypothetical protein